MKTGVGKKNENWCRKKKMKTGLGKNKQKVVQEKINENWCRKK